jgi:hypothetical protein
MVNTRGNPNLKTYQFQSDRPDPLTEKFTLRISPAMFDQLKSLGEDWREFVRDAINDKLKKQ